MGHKKNSFEDDEPLLSLSTPGRISDASTANQHTKDIITTTSKVSGSTAHESKSSSSSSGTINDIGQSSSRHHHHDHHHHQHSHSSDDVHSRRPPGIGEGVGATEEELDEEPLLLDDEDEPISLEALRESEKDKRRLKIAIGLCSTFFVVELLGGLWAESLALLSDSFHLLTGKTFQLCGFCCWHRLYLLNTRSMQMSVGVEDTICIGADWPENSANKRGSTDH